MRRLSRVTELCTGYTEEKQPDNSYKIILTYCKNSNMLWHTADTKFQKVICCSEKEHDNTITEIKRSICLTRKRFASALRYAGANDANIRAFINQHIK